MGKLKIYVYHSTDDSLGVSSDAYVHLFPNDFSVDRLERFDYLEGIFAIEDNDSEYIGFCMENSYPDSENGSYAFPDNERLSKPENLFALSEQTVYRAPYIDTRGEEIPHQNIYSFCAMNQTLFDMADLDAMMKYLNKKYPQIHPYMKREFDSSFRAENICFIMPSKVFTEFQGFLKDVTEYIDASSDYSMASISRLKTVSYIAKLLFKAYCEYLSAQGVEVKNVGIASISSVKPAPVISPLSDSSVAILLATDSFYVPYCYVAMKSIVLHASSDRIYDFIIFETQLKPEEKEKLSGVGDGAANISVRFCDPKMLLGKHEAFLRNTVSDGRITVETYFRLFSPFLLPEFDKILYLDCDMVACDDVAKLYDENLDGYLLGGVADTAAQAFYNGTRMEWAKYFRTIDADMSKYYNAGMTLFNLKMFRELYTIEQLQQIIGERTYRAHDQDILNIIGKGRLRTLDARWDLCTYGRRYEIDYPYAPKQVYLEYMQARKSPGIIHYAGIEKPWNKPQTDMGEYFWEVARQTPYYEVILSRMCAYAINDKLKETQKGVALSASTDTRRKPRFSRLLPEGSKRRGFFKKIYNRVRRKK